MAVPVKFTPDMSDVKRAIAEVRSDASKGATFDISAGRSGLGSGGNSATPPANSILQSAEYSPVWRNWNNLPKGGNVNVDTANAFRQMGGLTGGGFPTPANPLAASNAHYASIAAGMQGWTTVGTTYPGGNVPAARPGPAANAPGAGGPSGGNWWNAVAALGTPAAPAGFWPGTGASGPPPAPPGQTPPGRSLWPGATSLGRYLGVGYITNEITRVADEGMTLSRETVLSGRGAMGGTDLMRQYKAQNRFNEAIAGLPVVGRVADLIVEAATGSKLDAESALQDAEQANERVDLSKRASTRRRLYSNDVTISAQRGGYAQAMARIAINGDEQYRAAKDEMNQMINAGDVAGGHKHFIEMSAWIQRDMEISRERATRGYRIELNLMGREAQRQKLLGEGRTDEAGLDAIHNEFDRRIAEEEDPNKKDAERTLGRATVLAYQKQVARRRQYAAEDTRDATIANQRMLDRDPLGARLSRVDHDERVAERDKERTDDQKRPTLISFGLNATASIKTIATASGIYTTNSRAISAGCGWRSVIKRWRARRTRKLNRPSTRRTNFANKRATRKTPTCCSSAALVATSVATTVFRRIRTPIVRPDDDGNRRAAPGRRHVQVFVVDRRQH
jgi:hypothetical protein